MATVQIPEKPKSHLFQTDHMPDPFYSTNAKYTAEKAISRALEEGRLVESDTQLIREYVGELQAAKQISEVRTKKIISVLVGWRRLIPVPYRSLSIADVYQGIEALKTARSQKGKPFKQNTIHDYISVLKPFLLWLLENDKVDSTNLPEKKVRRITAPPVDFAVHDGEDLLTIDEVEALLQGCRTSRDRALLATLYETGARVAEIGRLRWRDLTFDQYGVKAWLTDRKTRKRRFSRLTLAAEYLITWHNNYPGETGPDAPVFVDQYGNPMTYVSISRTITRAARRAGIEKRITPHLFRSSRITHMVVQNYQESVIMETAWGNVNTAQLRTYLKLREKDLDQEFLRRAGIEVEEEGNARRLERPCGRCHYLNPPTNDRCGKCGMPLTQEAEDRIALLWDDVLQLLETDPARAAALARALRKKGEQ